MRRSIVAAVAVVGLTLGPAPARAIQLTLVQEQLYSSVEAVPPSANRMMVCYGFVCRLRVFLYFSAAERAALTNIMAKGKASAAEERKALQQAFVWFDRRVGREVGTDRRVARADFRFRDDDHNFDCYDTTRNAVSLLLVLREWGLLRHHTIEDPVHRAKVLIGQTPHNSAVIKEKAGGKAWVVDMWTTKFGQVPDVMTVEKWMDED